MAFPLTVALALLLAVAGPLPPHGPGGVATSSLADCQGIVIVANGPLTPGGTGTVSVVPLAGEKDIEVTVELNGVELPRLSYTEAPDGTVTVTFPVPAAAAGGSVSVTASAGGSGAATTVPVGAL